MSEYGPQEEIARMEAEKAERRKAIVWLTQNFKTIPPDVLQTLLAGMGVKLKPKAEAAVEQSNAMESTQSIAAVEAAPVVEKEKEMSPQVKHFFDLLDHPENPLSTKEKESKKEYIREKNTIEVTDFMNIANDTLYDILPENFNQGWLDALNAFGRKEFDLEIIYAKRNDPWDARLYEPSSVDRFSGIAYERAVKTYMPGYKNVNGEIVRRARVVMGG